MEYAEYLGYVTSMFKEHKIRKSLKKSSPQWLVNKSKGLGTELN